MSPLALPPESFVFPASATVVDVSARDGLQNLSEPLSPENRAKWVTALLESGVEEVEAASFVNPARLPAMAGAELVLANIEKRFYERIWVLVPNRRGFERAVETGARNVLCVASATESHSTSNLGRPVAAVMEDLAAVPDLAAGAGVRARIALSVAWGEEESGETNLDGVASQIARLADMGFSELTLCDTWGGASPIRITGLIGRISRCFPHGSIGLHLHDTFGFASANTLAGLVCGVTRHEGSVLGLGGCPFLPGARGNVDTVNLIRFLNALGVATVPVAGDVARAAAYCQTMLIGRNAR